MIIAAHLNSVTAVPPYCAVAVTAVPPYCAVAVTYELTAVHLQV
jgi:hypothetical protein